MSENAIHVHAAASATGTPSLSLAAGPGALRTTVLMARITFLEAARRKILWIATLAGLSHMENGRFHNYTTADGLSSDRIITVYQDHGGGIWVGTSTGIDRLAGDLR